MRHLLIIALLHASVAVAADETPAAATPVSTAPEAAEPAPAPAPDPAVAATAAPAVMPSPAATIPDAAPAKESDFGWAFLGALEMGGDTFGTVYFEDGSSQNVKTGQGGTLGIGARYRPYVDAPWGVRSTLGYKFVTTKAENADIGIDRLVWDLVVNRRVGENTWIGGGVVRHMNIKFSGGGFTDDVGFDNAMGLRLEAGWRYFALAYTSMTYTDDYGFEYDANSLGLVITNAF